MREVFCEKCGRLLDDDDIVCPLCHRVIKQVQMYEYAPMNVGQYTAVYNYSGVGERSEKSRIKAGFLQIFLGALGVGRFYLGYKGMGIFQIAASLVSCGVAGIVWGFVDGVSILDGHVLKDASGKMLAD